MVYKKLIQIFFTIAVFNIICYSQWTSDSAANTSICSMSGQQTTPKISPSTDGGCYIAWFDNRGGSYAVYLQRLNQNGVKQLPADGLLISSNPQSSSLVDWDMVTDSDNNAIIAFTDTRAGSSINPYIYKIGPSGSFLWGANGITLTDSSGVYQANPKLAKTSDGNIVVAWIWGSTPQKFALMKLSQAGVKLWNGGIPVRMSGSVGENWTYPALIQSDNGAVILLWSGYTGTFINPQNYRLYSSKLSSSGLPLWSNPQDTIFDLGGVAGFFVPKLITDDANGAIYVWQDSRSGVIKAAVQRMNSSGIKQFPPNGTQVSTQAGRLNLDAWACINSVQETYLFWKEANSTQSQFGFYGQKLSPAGARQWTDNGLEIIPLSTSYSFINNMCFAYDTAAVVIYNEAPIGVNNFIKAFRIGRAGNIHWGPKSLSSISSSKSKITAAANNGMFIDTWMDGRNDGGDIYAQNIWYNGVLGNITGLKKTGNEIPDEFRLYQNYPNPFNPVTKIQFNIPPLEKGRLQEGYIRLIIYNSLGQEVEKLVNNYLQPGEYETEFDGSGYPGGVYYYRITIHSDELIAGDYTDVRKMILLK